MSAQSKPAIQIDDQPWGLRHYLVSGDPLNPLPCDLIAQTAQLHVGAPVPCGWRVLTGNGNYSSIGRLALRSEVDPPVAGPRDVTTTG